MSVFPLLVFANYLYFFTTRLYCLFFNNVYVLENGLSLVTGTMSFQQ